MPPPRAFHRYHHLCIDMQEMFLRETPWQAPWMQRTLPVIEEIAARHPHQTIFTRFIPPLDPQEGQGAWRTYYERWQDMTRSRLPPDLIELAAPLRRLVPPAGVIDKAVYSPWLGTALHAHLVERGIGTLVITGGETDVCVLAAVMGAIDLGYRVILPADALHSSADQTHDAMMQIYRSRFAEQLTVCSTDDLLHDRPRSAA